MIVAPDWLGSLEASTAVHRKAKQSLGYVRLEKGSGKGGKRKEQGGAVTTFLCREMLRLVHALATAYDRVRNDLLR